MVRINFYAPFLFTIKYISFSCSPIDGQRFRSNFKKRMRRLTESLDGPAFLEASSEEPTRVDLWSAIRNPLMLIKLVKRYHMAGNVFIMAAVLHILILLHMTSKGLIHLIFVSPDSALNDYFNEIYYPHLMGVFPKPHLFNNLIVALCAYSLSVRLLSAYNLIRSAIVNANGYKELRITQINLTSLTLYNLTLENLKQFVLHSLKHNRSRLRENPKSMEAHLKLNGLIQKELPNLSLRDQLYRLNVIDFEECYSRLGFFKISQRGKRYRSWYCPPPGPRVSIGLLRNSIALNIGSFLLWGCALSFYLAAIVYLELRSTLPKDSGEPSPLEVFKNWSVFSTEPYHLVRLAELFLFFALQVPHQCDAVLIFMDATILISRAKKLIDILESDLELCKREINPPGFNNTQSLHHWQVYRKYSLVNGSNKELNELIQRHIMLSNLLYTEFKDVRRAHTKSLNLLVFGHGICLSYTMSLFFTISTFSELIILLFSSISSIIPTLNTLVFCAGIERSFKKLYIVLCNLSVAKDGVLDKRTLEMIRTGSEHFEQESSRSFIVFGLYPITANSVTPVSFSASFYDLNPLHESFIDKNSVFHQFIAYMATLILFLNRFVVEESVP